VVSVSFSGRIFVPVDLSSNSLQAVRVARDLSTPSSEITLFHAIDPEDRRLAGPARSGPSARESLNGLLAHCIGRLRQIRRAELPDTPSVNLAVCVGEDAEDVICRGARRNAADVIVLSAHGRSDHPDRVPGHVAAAVVRGAPCPVMVVRSYAGARRSGGSRSMAPAREFPGKGRSEKTSSPLP
jgi:nucleotide-binding universal stress UspA family protein